jgi:hypothetical protein
VIQHRGEVKNDPQKKHPTEDSRLNRHSPPSVGKPERSVSCERNKDNERQCQHEDAKKEKIRKQNDAPGSRPYERAEQRWSVVWNGASIERCRYDGKNRPYNQEENRVNEYSPT